MDSSLVGFKDYCTNAQLVGVHFIEFEAWATLEPYAEIVSVFRRFTKSLGVPEMEYAGRVTLVGMDDDELKINCCVRDPDIDLDIDLFFNPATRTYRVALANYDFRHVKEAGSGPVGKRIDFYAMTRVWGPFEYDKTVFAPDFIEQVRRLNHQMVRLNNR